MVKHRIDDRTVDRLLSGRLSADDAPPGFGHVAEAVGAALAPASQVELAREASVVSMAAAVTAEAVSTSSPALAGARTQRRSMISKLLTAKAAATATVVALGLGTAAAAATGSLPDQTSNASSHAASGLATANAAVSSSQGSDSSNGSSNQSGATSKSPIAIGGVNFSATGPANGHAVPGLCTALEAQFAQDPTSPSFTNSTAFKDLISKIGGTPTAANTWCKANVSSTGNSGSAPDSNANQPSGKPSGTGSSTEHTSVVPTPNSGGTTTANTASNGTSDTGTNTADTASGSHSSAGSENSAHR